MLSGIMAAVGAALLIAAGVAWSAAGATAGAAAEVRKGGTLRLGELATSVRSIRRLAGTDSTLATCAKLFNYPDEAGAAGTRLIPEVVTASTVSRDGRTYVFELKRTFRFHTGAAVTARSFADAFNRVANPRLESPGDGLPAARSSAPSPSCRGRRGRSRACGCSVATGCRCG